ncbi:hypothetical protein [Salibacterium lacus]|uniref:Uncharacterized protein n=1 Tax=Salibacterium lacus TaxID=1898109 RepID=A0ABW5SZK6_9BACI
MTNTKTIELPEIPKEVAEQIELLRERSDVSEREMALEVPEWNFIIRNYIGKAEPNATKYYRAIVNGYNTEKSPKEQLREYYDNLPVGVHAVVGNIKRQGVRDTLDILGITIPGVNAPAEETGECEDDDERSSEEF